MYEAWRRPAIFELTLTSIIPAVIGSGGKFLSLMEKFLKLYVPLKRWTVLLAGIYSNDVSTFLNGNVSGESVDFLNASNKFEAI